MDRDGAGWSRRRLLSVLVLVVLAAVLLLAGLAYAVHAALAAPSGARETPHQTPAGANGTHDDARATTPPRGPALPGGQRRDRIAAAPMLPVDASDARPTPPATRLAEPIRVPVATRPGPAMVPTGFPHTPEGAVGQLAAIEVSVLQAMSIPATHEVYDAWALLGGVGAQAWSMTGNVRAFLGAARMGEEKDPGTVVLATPAGAQVKGTDGPDWVLACVLLGVRAVITADAKIGYGHCERMQWHPEPAPAPAPGPGSGGGVEAGGRWMIAAGDPPAPAPSTWPGTELP